MKKFISSLAALLIILTINAQEFSKFTKEDFKKDENYGWFNYIQVTGYKGDHMVEDPGDIGDIFGDGFWGLGFRLGTQSKGGKGWQRVHGYPQYGFGVSFFDLGGTDIDTLIGQPGAFYFFFGAPIVRFGNFRLNGDVEIGISTDFNPYDSETNPTQNYIGASQNLHSNFTLQLYYELSQRMDLALGLSFMHFSNGRTFTPQKGINLIGLNLSTAYHFNPVKNFTKHVDPDYQPAIRPTFIKEEKPAFKPHHEFIVMGSIGTVQAMPGDFKDELGQVDTTGAKGPRYMTNSITAEYAYQFARKLKVVGGLDMFYDGSVEYLYDDILPQDTKFKDKSFYGAHVGFHYLIERVSFIFNYGRYIHKPFPQRGEWFMRVGGRIGLTDNLDAHVALKTRNGGIADWIEWGLAYKFKSK